MKVKLFSKVFGFAVIMLLSANLYSQAIDAPNAINDCNVLLGAGLLYHSFAEADDIRKATGTGALKDEIKWGSGFQFNAELLLNNTFSLDLPVGLAAGYRFQTVEGGFEYSFSDGSSITRKVNIMNNIGYVNVLLPLDNEKYWLLGCSAGLGASSYKYTLDYSNLSPDTKGTSKGTVIPLSIFLDWGADGVGARFGYTYVMSNYADKIGGMAPKGNGNQLFFDLRYAI